VPKKNSQNHGPAPTQSIKKGLFNRILLALCTGVCGFTQSASADQLLQQPVVQLGIDQLAAANFKYIQGQRVGLLTNQAGVNQHGVSTIDVLKNSHQVQLVALFGPEHGIYGDEKANIPVDDKVDPRTQLPVYSLYGKYRKPTAEMLRQLDCMVIDLQDLGVRSYTYVSCMRYTMEACFENGVTVVVLDRPNPLGGLKVDGPPLDEHLMSYVGAFQVPYVHGLTIAELALMAKKRPGWLQVSPTVQAAGKLIIIPMKGWRRSMLWSDTGLQWVGTSPAIPDLSAALGYAMTGLGSQLGGFTHGYGGPYPFRLLNFPGKTPAAIATALNAVGIPGVRVTPHQYQTAEGKIKSGALVLVTDWQTLRPTALSFYMMRLTNIWSDEGNPFAQANQQQARLYNIHVGSEAWWDEITTQGAHADVEKFIQLWQQQAHAFQQMSQKYWLYEL